MTIRANPVEQRPAPMRYGVALAAVALALALKLLLDPVITQETPFLLLFGAIMLGAWYGGLGPGLFATLLAGLATYYLFLRPVGYLSLLGLEATPLWVFLLEGALVSALTAALHGAKGRAETSAQQTLERQQQLRSSEERFRLLVDGVEDYAIFMLDSEGHIVSWNAGAQRIMGYEAEEVVGKHFSLFFTPEAVKDGAPERELEGAVREGRFEDEALRVCKNGSTFEANVILTTLRDESGQPRGFAKVVRDITERKRAEEALRRSLASLLALYEAGRAFSSSLKHEEICSELLAVVKQLPGVSMAAVELGDEQEQAGGGGAFVTSEDVWPLRSAPEAEDARRQSLRAGTVAHAQPPPEDPEAPRLQALFLPLSTRGRAVGVLEVYGSKALAERDNVDTLFSLAGQAAGALENARLYEQLARRERQMHELVGRMLVAQEEERRRVAYEVHDGPTQLAVAAFQRLQEFAEDYPPAPPRAREDLEEAIELVRQTVGESRRLIGNLRPTVLDDLGLSAAVRQQIAQLREDGCEVSYQNALGEDRLPAAIETALFRIAQEALNNVRKHARTARARVALRRTGKKVRLEIQDWGVGFQPEAAREEGGPGERVGLSSMHERAALLGGTLEIESRAGAGTLLTAEVPLPEEGGVLNAG